MSRSIYSTDDVWVETLPHIIEPQLQQKEWLLGFVLRCDKVNDWAAGTTLKLVTRHVSSMRQLGAIGSFVAAEQINIALLAQLINVSIDVVQKTTYRISLARLYSTTTPSSWSLGAIPPFRVCPACLQDDILTKWLALPLLRTCPIHKCFFRDHCACGAPLQPFHSMSAPFTCGVCGRPWQELARVDADPDIVGGNAIILDCYDHFLERGSASSIKAALAVVRREINEWDGASLHEETILGVRMPRYLSPTASVTFLVASMAFFHLPLQDSVPPRLIDVPRLTCLNPACSMVGHINRGNIKGAGYRDDVYEYYCVNCGSRFSGDHIYISFDDICSALPNGPRLSSIRRAQERVAEWSRVLGVVCGEMLASMDPINTDVAFSRAGIPRKGWYRARRLGLVGIVQEYAQRQREVMQAETGVPGQWTVTRHMYRKNPGQEPEGTDASVDIDAPIPLTTIPTTRRCGQKITSVRSAYASDVTDAEWDAMHTLVTPLIPVKNERREIVNAILFVLDTKCGWPRLPVGFPKYKTVSSYYWQWQRDGTWQKIEAKLCAIRAMTTTD